MSNVSLVSRCESSLQGVLLGAFIADAATAGVHWVYDTTELDKAITDGNKQACFLEPPINKYYSTVCGDSSIYGLQCLETARYLSSAKDGFDAKAFSHQLRKYAETTTSYVDHSTRELKANLEGGKEWPLCGADDSQANCIVKAPAVVCAKAGLKDFTRTCADAIRVHQNHDKAVQYGLAAAYILEELALKSMNLEEAVRDVRSRGDMLSEVKASIDSVMAAVPDNLSPRDAAGKFGASCALPGSFELSLYLLLTQMSSHAAAGATTTHSTTEDCQTPSKKRKTETDAVAKSCDVFQSIIEANALAGGDNCSRAVFIGACLGGVLGKDAIPEAWCVKAKVSEEAHALAKAMLELRGEENHK